MTPTKMQQLMIDDGMPPALVLMTDEERAAAWVGTSPVPTLMAIGNTVMRRAPEVSDAVLREVQAREADKRARALERKRDAEAIRKRALKNQRTIRLAAEGKIALPPEPVKIVRVVDLGASNAATPQTQEADMAKKAKKAKAKKTAKKAGPKKLQQQERADGGGRPVNEVVLKVARMMQRKGGATMKEMVDDTGVEAHPMRAKIKQAREMLGLTVDSPRWQAPSKENGGRYRILEAAPAGKDFAAQQPAPEAS